MITEQKIKLNYKINVRGKLFHNQINRENQKLRANHYLSLMCLYSQCLNFSCFKIYLMQSQNNHQIIS